MNLALLNLELRPHRLIMKFNALMMQILMMYIHIVPLGLSLESWMQKSCLGLLAILNYIYI